MAAILKEYASYQQYRFGSLERHILAFFKPQTFAERKQLLERFNRRFNSSILLLLVIVLAYLVLRRDPTAVKKHKHQRLSDISTIQQKGDVTQQ